MNAAINSAEYLLPATSIRPVVRVNTTRFTAAFKVAGLALMLAATTVVGLVAASVSVPGVPAQTGQVQLTSDAQWTVNNVISQAVNE
jgi:hypothetical protein